jgi:transporter family-2 protein
MKGTGGMTLLLMALGIFAGANLAFQALISSQLRSLLVSPLRASLVSYVGGTLCCVAFLIARRESVNVFAGRAVESSPILWTAGLYGLIYLLIAIWLLPRMGSTQVFALVVAGQLLAAALFDAIGLFGVSVRPLDLSKVLGIAMLVAAVYLIRR